MRRVLSALFLLFLLIAWGGGEAYAARQKNAGGNPKYASIVIDAQTGAVVSARHADKVLHPASLTKVMTLLLLFEAIESGQVRINDKIRISANAAAEPPSKIGLKAGSTIRVEDAILALVTKSANDISTAIAEHLAGSESRFAQKMTRRARDIGMSRTTFRNAHGLHNPAQVSSARDMATLARYVILRYPNFYRYFSTKQFTYRGVTYNNHNRLMQTYPGMDGFKTGFINASGFNLIASAKRQDQRLIGVVFGGRSWKTRNDHMAELLNTGFNKLPQVLMARQNTPAAPLAPVAQPAQTASVDPPPKVPDVKPVYRVTGAAAPASMGAQGTGILQLPPERAAQYAAARASGFTSLSALDQGQRIVAQQPAPDIAETAAKNVSEAINRGDYSELTGEGDYDAATVRRVETGLLAAAVYKGEHDKARQISAKAFASSPDALRPQDRVLPPDATTVRPVALAATPSSAELWSVQLGAYTSRVATDEALRRATAQLPSGFSHARPMVVPLQTGQGVLFRARLGGLSQAEATEACRYFRDCLPIEPR